MSSVEKRMEWFVSARYGMFFHFGLFSMLGRGEWVLNKEQIPLEEYRKLANDFNPVKFDAEELCQLAIDSGMKYIVFTTMHHEGFRLYDSDLTDFCSTKTRANRDFVADLIASCRKNNLRVGLYHSLNNWMDQPDGVAALESKDAYDLFIENTFARIRELVEKYTPFDILWYDGWWPFHARGWQSERMNEMVRSIQPDIILNGRNALPGDYATPEGHLTQPTPWRPWETCMTLNNHWGYHVADNNWKSPIDVVNMLTTMANRRGNLLLNVGPKGDGSIPDGTLRVLNKVGNWINNGGGSEALAGDEMFTFDYQHRADGRNDWDNNGVFTVDGNTLYFVMKFVPGTELVLTGVETQIKRVTTKDAELSFSQQAGKVQIELPAGLAGEFCPVLKMECSGSPSIYRTAGMRVPDIEHPHYDPCESDLIGEV